MFTLTEQNNTQITSARNKLVYRGDNPVFDRLSKDLSFETEKIPDGDDRVTNEEALKSFYDEEASRYDNIFTDDKAHHEDYPNVVNAYNLVDSLLGEGDIERWPDRVGSVADHFRNKDRQPIISPYGLSHHFSNGYETIEDKLKEHADDPRKHKQAARDLQMPTVYGDSNKKDVRFAGLLSEYTNTPSIPYDTGSFKMVQERRGGTKVNGSVAEGIIDAGVDPDEAVVLTDHHVRDVDAQESGFASVDIYTICQCCIGLDPAYQDSLEKKGFNFVRDNVEEDVFYPELRSRIMEYTEDAQ